jgi:phosphate starvation-inducible protein PhoH
MTFDNAIIIVDELQNCSGHELDSVKTRVGDSTKIIFCGDGRQSDFSRVSDKAGLGQFLKIVDRMAGIEHIEFTINDCVRSNFVRQYLIEKDAVEHDGSLQATNR